MVPLDIRHFAEGRTKARAYFCYLFSKNIQNRLPSITDEMIIPSLLKIKSELENCDGVYLLDATGTQTSPTYTKDRELTEDIGKNRSDRAYYYRSVREERCIITDPYPSLITGQLTVTTSYPVFDENDNLRYVACIDIPLDEVLKVSHLSSMDKIFSEYFKFAYASFAIALAGIALLLFVKGVESFFSYGIVPSDFKVKDIFEATILLTLSLAIFDLSKTLMEEEILGRYKEHDISGPHKTMVRFLGSIIIALSIEALMLVFKFAITDPNKLIYAIYIIAGVALLIISLAIYIKFTKLHIDE
ncbi:PDC sensor domain-containing protein [Sulfurimonas sp.]